MTRIFLEQAIGEKTLLELTGDKAHYLSTVLRSGPGEAITVTDSSGTAYTARIVSASKKRVALEIQEQCPPAQESPVEITLLQGLLKGEKMDMVIQKACELGVKRILPVITERSQIRETRKLVRWQKIAEEASRQCGRAVITKVLEPLDFASIHVCDEPDTAGIIFWETAENPFSTSLEKCAGRKQVILCIGPEGGFSESEIRTAAEKGFHLARMGSRILRAETAAIAAVSIAQFILGDLSGRPETGRSASAV
jgi:16S rRNA (uracil1498-N3)-methyltransferase